MSLSLNSAERLIYFMRLYVRFIIFIILFIVLVSCQTMDDYRDERIARADEHFLKIKNKEPKEGELLTLPKCIELALENNLDMKVYDLKLAVMREKKTAAMLGMLPDLTVTDDMGFRNNDPGAKSVALTGTNAGQTSLNYSTSTPRYVNRVKVEMLFSVIDFGLAYFSAVQQEDNKLITAEQQRRAAQNLIFDVTRAYIEVAGAQYVIEQVSEMLKMADDTDTTLKEISKTKKMPLLRVVDEQKRFLSLKKQLKEYIKTYEHSCIELRSLMGYYPTSRLKVDTAAMNDLNKMKVVDVRLLERIALIERPELYQLDMQRHVTILEARKTLITMCPNVRAFIDYTGSSNFYLYNNQWWEVGARAAYHLMRIPQQIGEYIALDTEADQILNQALALSCGIIAQVRIAEADLRESEENFKVADQAYNVYSENLDLATKKFNTTKDISPFELKRLKMEKTYAGIERIQALGNYYLAYQRLLNAVGIESLDYNILENLKLEYMETMADTVDDNKELILKLNREINEYSGNISKLNDSISNEFSAIASCEKKIKNLKDALHSIKNDHSNFSDDKIDEIQSYTYKIEKSKTTIEEMKDELRENEEEFDELNNELAQYKNQIDIYNDNLEAFRKAKDLLNETTKGEKVDVTLPDNIHETESQEQQTTMSPVETTKGEKVDVNLPDNIHETESQEQQTTMSPVETSKRVTDDDLINMETQVQSGLNNISPEEFQNNLPNVQIETMRDADNNELNAFEYDPELSNNIEQQSIYENIAGNVNKDNEKIGDAGPSGDNEGSLESNSLHENENIDIFNPPLTDWVQPGRNGN